jgi:hypothetical protein
MNVLIRHFSTQLYLGNNQWIGTRGQARRFDNSFAAIRYCASHNIEDYDVLADETVLETRAPRFHVFKQIAAAY